jgi:septal ring factor EnvC (AmiA/AmiB activator)
VDLDTANNILGFVAALMAVGATVAVTWVLRWWVPQQAIRTLRGEVEWNQSQLAEKDKELSALRVEVAGHERRISELDKEIARLTRTERDRRAYMFSLEHYSKRLEVICLESGRDLPPRINGWDSTQ